MTSILGCSLRTVPGALATRVGSCMASHVNGAPSREVDGTGDPAHLKILPQRLSCSVQSVSNHTTSSRPSDVKPACLPGSDPIDVAEVLLQQCHACRSRSSRAALTGGATAAGENQSSNRLSAPCTGCRTRHRTAGRTKSPVEAARYAQTGRRALCPGSPVPDKMDAQEMVHQ